MMTYALPEPSLGLSLTFVALALGVAAGLPLAARRAGLDWRPSALLVTFWVLVTGTLAHTGVLSRFEPLPPPLMVMMAVGALGTVGLALSSWGGRLVSGLSLAGLVGFQAFRFPLELAMHRAYEEGLMPVQMSFEGRNLDILTGITALFLALLLARRSTPAWLVWTWNLAGLGLLINIVTVAILSTPVPFRAFFNDPPNVWVTLVPFVWLPAVLVMAALFGHLAVARKLLQARKEAPPS